MQRYLNMLILIHDDNTQHNFIQTRIYWLGIICENICKNLKLTLIYGHSMKTRPLFREIPL